MINCFSTITINFLIIQLYHLKFEQKVSASGVMPQKVQAKTANSEVQGPDSDLSIHVHALFAKA